MKYKAPDGNIIESNSNEPVVYECNVGGIPGTYTSYETQSANNAFGIKQMKIVREITEESTKITITESNSEELQEYLLQIQRDNQTSLGLPNNSITEINLN